MELWNDDSFKRRGNIGNQLYLYKNNIPEYFAIYALSKNVFNIIDIWSNYNLMGKLSKFNLSSNILARPDRWSNSYCT